MPAVMTSAASPARTDLSSGRVLLMASGAGLAVASLYYNQPMLGILGNDLGASDAALGWIPALTQLGYAVGILLLAPLGDRYDRKRIILGKIIALALALLLAGLAPGIEALLGASFALGLAATLAQDIVPAAATLAAPEHRGRIVGSVMTGLLLGILLSRVVSGLVAEQLGWRTMFMTASAAILILGAALWRGLPAFAPTTRLSYGALLGSLATLWRQYAALRRAVIAQGLLSLAFSAFWSTLAVMLHAAPFQLGAGAAGAFGLAGAAGALAAPLAGRSADRHGPATVARRGALLAAASFALMIAVPMLSPYVALGMIAISAIGFDLGIQMSLIAHQSLVYSLDPAARSRLNAILMVGIFVGMAAGGALGSLALARYGWTGVVVLAIAASLGALLLRVRPTLSATRP